MKVVWVTRSFLDYRIPVYKELNKKLNGNLFLVYNADYIPERVHIKATETLKENAIGLRGEFKIGPDDFGDYLANKKVRLPFQPKLIKTIKKLKPDVIITDGFFQWTYAALWLRAFKNIPHVMCYERTFHTERNVQWFRTYYRKFAARFIDTYCASGKLCGDYLESLGVKKNRITFGHMVADISGIVDSKIVKDTKSNHLTYLYVGKLIERKGIKELLYAWGNFQKGKEDKVKLNLVGNGELRDFVSNHCQRLNIENVNMLGHVDYDLIGAVYSQADIFVIPTLEDNWSLVVPEAMANGLPILCSFYNGCWPEYIQSHNGWVFDPLSEEDFVSKLNESYFKENLKVMGSVSKKIIHEFNKDYAVRGILDAVNIACK